MAILDGKVAVVTGGSRGIGAAIAVELARAGARVFIIYNKNRGDALYVSKACSDAYPYACKVAHTIYHADVSKRKQVAHVINDILKANRFSKIDILVNNAGIHVPKDFLKLTDADILRTLKVNLLGTMIPTQLVLPHMLTRKYGRIINISSIAGQWGGVQAIDYAASKAAVINFTKSMARLYADRGITCNCIAPGLVDTDMLRGDPDLSKVPIGRIATAEEIATTVVHLSSDATTYITGQTIGINGGSYA